MTQPEHDDFVNEILLNAPDSWDDDAAAEAIAIDYVRKLEERLQYLGSTLEKYDASEADGALKPYFVLKCTDALAPAAIKEYQRLCGSQIPGSAGREQARQVALAYDEMRAYQVQHRDEVHLPDHDHVPAVG